MENKNIKEELEKWEKPEEKPRKILPVIEEPVEREYPEKPDEPFIDREKIEHLSIKDLWVGTIKDIVTKAIYTLLTETQKTDLTDGGATTLHKHDHGDMDGKGDDDHTQYHNNTRGDARYIKKDGSTAFTGTGAGFKDEDAMGSNSATAAASQQSIKKYVDDNAGQSICGGQEVANNNDLEISCGFQPSLIKIESYGYRQTGGGSVCSGNASAINSERCAYMTGSGNHGYESAKIIYLKTNDNLINFATANVKTIGSTSFTLEWDVWATVGKVWIIWEAFA